MEQAKIQRLMETKMAAIQKKRALKFIIFLGFVSLFADITYEGGRSITGPFMAMLGASGATVGFVVGIGELIGYGFRGLFGYLTDKTKKYWTLTFIGYIVNLLAIPLLSIAGSWQIASFLIILERFGKAIRVPPRDVMLSYATKQTGRGFGFGLHEALDQVGAVVGPLLIALALYFKESYQLSFALLLIPALFSLSTLAIARFFYPKPEKMENEKLIITTKGFSKKFWVYILAVGLVGAGYADFALIAYHFQKKAILSADWIPLFYALAMFVDGLAALIMGKLFDIKGISIMAFITAIASLFAPLVFLGNFTFALIGILLFGIGFGAQESIMRAIVATLVEPSKRGSAYGILNLSFGIFWAVGSAIMGKLYDISIIYLVVFSMILQLTAIPFFLSLRNDKK